jgi:hypothetical protein
MSEEASYRTRYLGPGRGLYQSAVMIITPFQLRTTTRDIADVKVEFKNVAGDAAGTRVVWAELE